MPAAEYKQCLQCGTTFAWPYGRSAGQWAKMRFCSQSCGRSYNGVTRGATTKLGKSPEYQSWIAMKSRCLNPNATAYDQYAGRGITICAEWRHDFAAFLRDMGPRPANTSLDRIDNDGNYEPTNCRWATPMEQAHNRRPTRREQATR